MRRMSGAARTSHFSTASWRALSELTFQVAMRTSADLVAPAALAGKIEPGRVGHGHDGHRPGLDRVGHDEIDVFGDRTDHVEGDDRDTDAAQLVGRDADVTAHD